MAFVEIYTLEFVSNNPYGSEFVAGDVITTFVDTDAAIVPAGFAEGQNTGITVFKNGIPLLSATDAISFDGQIYRPSGISPCKGTYLLQFGTASLFPFAFYYSLGDHPSCAVVPVPCDLLFSGAPVITPASGITVKDGSIDITATSSRPIEYRLSQDFIYGDGTAQSTGLFTNLYPGRYRVFARDAGNCAVNTLVQVNFLKDYEDVLFRLEYDDIIGGQTRVDIVRKPAS